MKFASDNVKEREYDIVTLDLDFQVEDALKLFAAMVEDEAMLIADKWLLVKYARIHEAYKINEEGLARAEWIIDDVREWLTNEETLKASYKSLPFVIMKEEEYLTKTDDIPFKHFRVIEKM